MLALSPEAEDGNDAALAHAAVRGTDDLHRLPQPARRPYPDQLVRATVNETCYICHAEKRGPFLWMHPPVAQNCANCHDPHGSINRSMLKLRPPRLCQQCHIGTFHPGSPGSPGSVFVFSRACTNCHSAIHGSNAPGGVDLTR
jgi:DmsE family decaheme c-type cytochrome